MPAAVDVVDVFDDSNPELDAWPRQQPIMAEPSYHSYWTSELRPVCPDQWSKTRIVPNGEVKTQMIQYVPVPSHNAGYDARYVRSRGMRATEPRPLAAMVGASMVDSRGNAIMTHPRRFDDQPSYYPSPLEDYPEYADLTDPLITGPLVNVDPAGLTAVVSEDPAYTHAYRRREPMVASQPPPPPPPSLMPVEIHDLLADPAVAGASTVSELGKKVPHSSDVLDEPLSPQTTVTSATVAGANATAATKHSSKAAAKKESGQAMSAPMAKSKKAVTAKTKDSDAQSATTAAELDNHQKSRSHPGLMDAEVSSSLSSARPFQMREPKVPPVSGTGDASDAAVLPDGEVVPPFRTEEEAKEYYFFDCIEKRRTGVAPSTMGDVSLAEFSDASFGNALAMGERRPVTRSLMTPVEQSMSELGGQRTLSDGGGLLSKRSAFYSKAASMPSRLGKPLVMLDPVVPAIDGGLASSKGRFIGTRVNEVTSDPAVGLNPEHSGRRLLLGHHRAGAAGSAVLDERRTHSMESGFRLRRGVDPSQMFQPLSTSRSLGEYPVMFQSLTKQPITGYTLAPTPGSAGLSDSASSSMNVECTDRQSYELVSDRVPTEYDSVSSGLPYWGRLNPVNDFQVEGSSMCSFRVLGDFFENALPSEVVGNCVICVVNLENEIQKYVLENGDWLSIIWKNHDMSMKEHTSLCMLNEETVVRVGGQTSRTQFSEMRQMSLRSGEVYRLRPMRIKRADPAIVFAPELGMLLCLGGRDNSKILVDFEALSLTTRKWRKFPRLSVGRFHFAHCIIGSRLFVAGGYARGGPVNTVEVISLEKSQKKWQKLTALPSARAGCVGTAVGAYFVVAGGHDSVTGREVYLLDTRQTRAKWARLALLNIPRKRPIICLYRGMLVVFGGNGRFDSMEVLSPETWTWKLYWVKESSLSNITAAVCFDRFPF